ncbi:MAG TPA: hypothetical protein VIL72_00185, partial [Beijerinckiaceae bacterium]
MRAAIARIETGAAVEPGRVDLGAALARRRAAFFEIAPARPLDRGAAAGFALTLARRLMDAEDG